MSEKLQNILWMAEELDFSMSRAASDQAVQSIDAFLTSAANPELSHSVYPA